MVRPRRFRRVRKAAGRRKALKGASPTLYKAIKAVAKSEALKAQETKYRATAVADVNVYNTLRSLSGPTPNYLAAAIPNLSTGDASADIVGAEATLVRGHTTFHFNLASNNLISQDIIVKVFCLSSRQTKTQNLLGNLTGKNLIRLGNAAATDWVPSLISDPRVIAQFPVNNLAWKGFVHTFRLSKNPGEMNGNAAGDVPNISSGASHTFTWHWWKKGTKKLIYDEVGSAAPTPPINTSFPSNFLPIFGVVAYYPDGTSVGSDDTVMPVFMQISKHMYYKDA